MEVLQARSGRFFACTLLSELLPARQGVIAGIADSGAGGGVSCGQCGSHVALGEPWAGHGKRSRGLPSPGECAEAISECGPSGSRAGTGTATATGKPSRSGSGWVPGLVRPASCEAGPGDVFRRADRPRRPLAGSPATETPRPSQLRGRPCSSCPRGPTVSPEALSSSSFRPPRPCAHRGKHLRGMSARDRWHCLGVVIVTAGAAAVA